MDDIADSKEKKSSNYSPLTTSTSQTNLGDFFLIKKGNGVLSTTNTTSNSNTVFYKSSSIFSSLSGRLKNSRAAEKEENTIATAPTQTMIGVIFNSSSIKDSGISSPTAMYHKKTTDLHNPLKQKNKLSPPSLPLQDLNNFSDNRHHTQHVNEKNCNKPFTFLSNGNSCISGKRARDNDRNGTSVVSTSQSRNKKAPAHNHISSIKNANHGSDILRAALNKKFKISKLTPSSSLKKSVKTSTSLLGESCVPADRPISSPAPLGFIRLSQTPATSRYLSSETNFNMKVVEASKITKPADKWKKFILLKHQRGLVSNQLLRKLLVDENLLRSSIWEDETGNEDEAADKALATDAKNINIRIMGASTITKPAPSWKKYILLKYKRGLMSNQMLRKSLKTENLLNSNLLGDCDGTPALQTETVGEKCVIVKKMEASLVTKPTFLSKKTLSFTFG